MSHVRSALALVVSAALLAGCGGGGGGKSAVPAGPASSSATQSGPKGTVALTLRFPANFHHAARYIPPAPKAAAIVRHTNGPHVKVASRNTLATRKPAYINPTMGNVLQIYVDSNLNQTIALPQTQGADGSQTFSVSIPAGQHNIFIQEYDSSGQFQPSDLLAQGTASNVTVNPATINTLALVMDMNPQGIVLTTDPVAGSDALLLATAPSQTPFCAYNLTQPVFAFPADSTGGYILPGTAVGGSVDENGLPAIPKVQTDLIAPSDASRIAVTPLAFSLTWASTTSTMLVDFEAVNSFNGSTASGYTRFGAQAAAPCQVSASFTPGTINGGDTATLQITGGTPPYTVAPPANTDCSTAAQADAPRTDQWTATDTYTGDECDYTVTDHNGTTATATFFTNALNNSLTVTPGAYNNFTMINQISPQFTVSGGVPPYDFGTPSDINAFTIVVIDVDDFEVQAGPDFASCATTTVTDSVYDTFVVYVGPC